MNKLIAFASTALLFQSFIAFGNSGDAKVTDQDTCTDRKGIVSYKGTQEFEECKADAQKQKKQEPGQVPTGQPTPPSRADTHENSPLNPYYEGKG